MKNIEKIVFLFLLLFCSYSCTTKAQDDNVYENQLLQNKPYKSEYPQDYFISPLKIPLSLAGTFAELRGSHFHSGIDIRTNERTGYAVIAPADGYISRIKVQAFGGGKNLYIVHPNGYTTVYMHLKSYAGKIEQFVQDYQYKNECYTFDYSFKKPSIYVHQGDTIAFSGESGAAQGPHLHFEIRDTKTERPINPLLFGLNIPDTTAPNILNFAITPNNNGIIEGSPSTKIISLADTNFKEGDTIYCLGDMSFSILAYDASYNSSLRNGVWKTELFVDTTLIFSHHIETFSFNDYGFVDATINYPLYITTGKRYLHSKKMAGCFLPFNYYLNDGILNVQTDSIYKISWRVTDLNNNSTVYSFYLKGIYDVNMQLNGRLSLNDRLFEYSKANIYKAQDGSLFSFPQGSLYEDIVFSAYKTKGKYSDIHHIHTVYEPVRKKFFVKIKPYRIDTTLKTKYLIVKINSKGYKSSAGGKLVGNYVRTTTGDFGTFTVWIDTVAPKIKNVNFKNNKRLSKHQKTLKVKITDNLSGINTYKAYLNGKWVLMEYDGKHAMLTYFIDDKLKDGKNVLEIAVTDAKNNIKKAEYTIIK